MVEVDGLGLVGGGLEGRPPPECQGRSLGGKGGGGWAGGGGGSRGRDRGGYLLTTAN